MTNLQNRGATVRSAREARGWTQEKLAEISGLSVRTLQRVEGKGIASFDTVHRLASALGLRSEELLRSKVQKRKEAEFTFLPRLTTGTAITNIIGGAEAYLPQHDEPNDESEADLIGRFLDLAHDWGECWDEVSPGKKTKVALSFKEELRELAENGFIVFGGRVPILFGNTGVKLSTAAFIIVRATSPFIIKLDDNSEVIAQRVDK